MGFKGLGRLRRFIGLISFKGLGRFIGFNWF